MGKTVYVIKNSGFGVTEAKDSDFGVKMLTKFLQTVESYSEKPEAICFYTEGVKSVINGSPQASILKQLEEAGVKLAVCKTCLNYYGLESEVAVGSVGGMDDIIGLINQADNVVTV